MAAIYNEKFDETDVVEYINDIAPGEIKKDNLESSVKYRLSFTLEDIASKIADEDDLIFKKAQRKSGHGDFKNNKIETTIPIELITKTDRSIIIIKTMKERITRLKEEVGELEKELPILFSDSVLAEVQLLINRLTQLKDEKTFAKNTSPSVIKNTISRANELGIPMHPLEVEVEELIERAKAGERVFPPYDRHKYGTPLEYLEAYYGKYLKKYNNDADYFYQFQLQAIDRKYRNNLRMYLSYRGEDINNYIPSKSVKVDKELKQTLIKINQDIDEIGNHSKLEQEKVTARSAIRQAAKALSNL